jgi:predicted RNase H-like HicB family nuclease
MRRGGALAEKTEPVFYDYPVKYQRDRTGWMVWTEGLPVFSIATSRLEARRKLKGALRAYFRSVIRHGDPLPAPPRRVSAERETIMVCVWPS